MTLRDLAAYIEGVAARVAAGEEQLDEPEGLVDAFVACQQFYTHKSPCPGVVRALVPPTSLREGRAALAAAITQLCSGVADALTPPAVAKRLGVSPETVIGWIKSGQLKASNIGKGSQKPRYRITPDDLATFLKKQQPEPPRTARKATPKKSSTKNYRS